MGFNIFSLEKRVNIERYARELIRDMHLYNEKSYINKINYNIHIADNGYKIETEEGSMIKEIKLPDNIYIYSNIKNNCISLEYNKVIINNGGSIEFKAKKGNQIAVITIIPTTGRITLKKE
ncbi:MAG: hypothetical protein Q4P31_03880 [Andreesenia angusta]|nr:hypothetical protein [Andreesenia angusta]